jgi:hypothetical protein
MTEEDIQSAVSMAITDMNSKMDSTIEKLKNNWGRGEKRTAREQQALIFARKLSHCGGTFQFTEEHRKADLKNIWEAMAFDLHDPEATIREKFANADEFSSLYRQGCNAFSEAMQEEWDDQIILCVPSTVNGGRIDFVTWDQSLIVNPKGEAGERTAMEVWSKRGEKRVSGQITSVAKKMLRVEGHDSTLMKISRIAQTAVDSLPNHLKRGSRELIS